MLRASTLLNSRRLFTQYRSPVMVILHHQGPKKSRPIKCLSTDCDENPPPVCPPRPCLMDYGPEYIGCWKDVYNERNKKANKELLLGILSVIFALIIVDRNGLVKGYHIPLFFPHM